MPISEKIICRINETKATKEEKSLMKKLLEIEDSGAYRFEAAYEKLIKEYVAENMKEDTQ